MNLLRRIESLVNTALSIHSDLDSYIQRPMPYVSNKRKLATWYRKGLKVAANNTGQKEIVRALDKAFEGLIEEIEGDDLDVDLLEELEEIANLSELSNLDKLDDTHSVATVSLVSSASSNNADSLDREMEEMEKEWELGLILGLLEVEAKQYFEARIDLPIPKDLVFFNKILLNFPVDRFQQFFCMSVDSFIYIYNHIQGDSIFHN
ncbi:hypothetical protein EV426DRAFT_576868 [Tirmania nivea]|nr:hypothetical protein EV426DRAFT_576868 [Tirmania nivea]